MGWSFLKRKTLLVLCSVSTSYQAMSSRSYEDTRQAVAYSMYRKDLPQVLLDTILQYLKKEISPPYGAAVDVGCGTGQSTVLLSPHFSRVVGCDVSKAQIYQAEIRRNVGNICYRVSSAEDLPLESNSVQLVTAGTCLHWLDAQRFFQEAKRVLVPGGVLAVYASYAVYPETGDPSCDAELRDLTNQLLYEDLKPYRSPEVYSVYEEYRNIYFPFEDVVRISHIKQKYAGQASDAAGYVRSMSTFQNLKDMDPFKAECLLRTYQVRMMEIIGSSADPRYTKLNFSREFFLVLCRNTKMAPNLHLLG